MLEIGDITQLLERAHSGDRVAREALFSRVYDDLLKLARLKVAQSAPFTELDATSLVHESYLRLTASRQPLPSGNRRIFFGYAAKVMRSVIVDIVRQRNAAKRGGGVAAVTLVTRTGAEESTPSLDIEALDEALQQLERIDARCHTVVEMRYFAGMSIEDIADVLELSPATVKRDWQRARGFLFRQMGSDT